MRLRAQSHGPVAPALGVVKHIYDTFGVRSTGTGPVPGGGCCEVTEGKTVRPFGPGGGQHGT